MESDQLVKLPKVRTTKWNFRCPRCGLQRTVTLQPEFDISDPKNTHIKCMCERKIDIYLLRYLGKSIDDKKAYPYHIE